MVAQIPENGGKRPIPDPTVLTTEQLLRAIAAERDYVTGQIAVLIERLNGIDTATELRLKELARSPMQMDEKIEVVTNLMSEKFRSINMTFKERDVWLKEKYDSIAQQFKERDIRSEREARDNKVAVDAAFAAQKEAASEQNKSNTLAITKSETATQETINKLAELFKTTTDALADKLAQEADDRRRDTEDAKDRISELSTNTATFVASSLGQKQGGNDLRATIAWGLTAVVSIATIITLIIAFKG